MRPVARAGLRFGDGSAAPISARLDYRTGAEARHPRALGITPLTPMNPAVQPIDVVKVGPTSGATAPDVAAMEEPLEIRLGGLPFVVIMRTPATTTRWPRGSCWPSRSCARADEIATMRYCTDDDGLDVTNVLNVWVAVRPRRGRGGGGRQAPRHGVVELRVCGRRSIDDLSSPRAG